jgi:shikimate kinase
MQRRDPWYREAAHDVIDARDLRKHQIAGAVLEKYYAATGILPPGHPDAN